MEQRSTRESGEIRALTIGSSRSVEGTVRRAQEFVPTMWAVGSGVFLDERSLADDSFPSLESWPTRQKRSQHANPCLVLVVLLLLRCVSFDYLFFFWAKLATTRSLFDFWCPSAVSESSRKQKIVAVFSMTWCVSIYYLRLLKGIGFILLYGLELELELKLIWLIDCVVNEI